MAQAWARWEMQTWTSQVRTRELLMEMLEQQPFWDLLQELRNATWGVGEVGEHRCH